MDWETFTIQPGCHLAIPSGICVDVPSGYALMAYEKSGVATKTGLIAGARVVDAGYQGEVHIHLINPTNKPVTVNRGQKIVQFVLMPVVCSGLIEVPAGEIYTEESSRGIGRFGSTGDC